MFEWFPTEKKDLGSIPALWKCSFSPWIKDHRDLCKISMYKTADKKWDLAIKNCLVTFHSDGDEITLSWAISGLNNKKGPY